MYVRTALGVGASSIGHGKERGLHKVGELLSLSFLVSHFEVKGKDQDTDYSRAYSSSLNLNALFKAGVDLHLAQILSHLFPTNVRNKKVWQVTWHTHL